MRNIRKQLDIHSIKDFGRIVWALACIPYLLWPTTCMKKCINWKGVSVLLLMMLEPLTIQRYLLHCPLINHRHRRWKKKGGGKSQGISYKAGKGSMREDWWDDAVVKSDPCSSRGQQSGLVPSTHFRKLTTFCNSGSRWFIGLFWPHRHMHTCAQTHI